LIAPNNIGHRTFGAAGGDNIGTYAVPGTPTGRLPVSSRYDVIEANVLLAFIAVGAGVEIHPRLRVGATFGYGFASTGFTTAVAPVASQDFARDIIAVVDAHDRFVPRIAFSIDAEPVDGLEVMAGFTWTADVKASGDLNLRPVFWGNIEDQVTQPRLPADEGWEDVTFPVNLTAPQTSVISFGTRYAMARPGARTTSDRVAGVPAPTLAEGEVSRPFDPMRDEVFDLELDVVVTLGSRVDTFNVVASPRRGPALGLGRAHAPRASAHRPPAQLEDPGHGGARRRRQRAPRGVRAALGPRLRVPRRRSGLRAPRLHPLAAVRWVLRHDAAHPALRALARLHAHALLHGEQQQRARRRCALPVPRARAKSSTPAASPPAPTCCRSACRTAFSKRLRGG
jgi:hypothetical protein